MDFAEKFPDIKDLNDYDAPISLKLGSIKTMYTESLGDHIVRIVQEVGFDIDKEGLAAALTHDQRRYTQAYRKGWADCEEHHKDLLKRIAKLTGYSVEEEEACKE